MTDKQMERILTEALGDGWREIAPGVYLAPPFTPPPAFKTIKQREIEKALEDLI